MASPRRERARPPAPRPPARADHAPCARNPSFLSRDIQAQKAKADPVEPKTKPESPVAKQSTDTAVSPPIKSILSPPKKQNPPKGDVVSPTKNEPSPPKMRIASPPKTEVASPPMRLVSPPKKENSPPVASFKIKTNDDNASPPKPIIKETTGTVKEMALKTEKLLAGDNGAVENEVNKNGEASNGDEVASSEPAAAGDESNGVGDKIKKFERAAEDASAPPGRPARPGSVRRGRLERLPSDPKEDLPPPATPFKDNVQFELGTSARQQSVTKNSPPKWPREQPAEEKAKKPEPQKIIKPEFKPMPSPADVTIRSPSLGAKIADQFPSHGTAFRNVASPSPDAARALHKFTEDTNNSKACKAKYSVSKGSSYFTRGPEEIWLVKKKDIEEIEERVLDSFRRAGGNVCARADSLRPASDGGHAHAHAASPFAHATMGRKRQMYARSESLDPQWAGARAQTLKRQTSVACTCGHDKKARARSAGAEPAAARARSRSHADDHAHAQPVLDKYETLV